MFSKLKIPISKRRLVNKKRNCQKGNVRCQPPTDQGSSSLPPHHSLMGWGAAMEWNNPGIT